MTWQLVIALTVVAYGLKALGLVVLGGRAVPPTLDRVLTLLPVALLTALIVTGTLAGGAHGITVDARLAGVAVAVGLAWRRAPLVVVIVAAAATTAAIRLFT